MTRLILFLNSVALFWMNDKSFRSTALAAGVNILEWPSCDARSVLAKFESEFKLCDDYEIAYRNCFQEISKIASGDVIPVPPDLEQFKLFYEGFMYEYRAQVLGQRLIATPDKAAELIHEFQSKVSFDAGVLEFDDVIEKTKKYAQEKLNAGKMLVSIQGWERLSKTIGGFNPGRVGMLVAKTGYGKTNLAISLATQAKFTMNVLYVNMEMIVQDIGERIAISKSEIDFGQYHSGQLPDFDLIKHHMQTGHSLWMTDGKDMGIPQIRAIARNLNERAGLGLIFVDYDQKIIPTDTDSPQWLMMQKTFVELEAMAKELNCFVLVAAQSNQEDQVSSSFRATFPCSVVMWFHEDDFCGPVIEFKKNRFGEQNKKIGVNYERSKTKITEGQYHETFGPEPGKPSDSKQSNTITQVIRKYQGTWKTNAYRDND